MKIIQANRRQHQCEQIWQGTPESVFPLLCPVRETEWIPGWKPELVVSNSGVMEPGCLFVEADAAGTATWVVTAYEPERCVDMFRLLPGVTVSRFTITLMPQGDGLAKATVSYQHTALGPEGDKVVEAFTKSHFEAFMAHFQAAIDHFLTTGNMISE